MNKILLPLFSLLLANTPLVAQEKLMTSRPIPLLAWVGVPEAETSVDRFRELRASGISINFSWYSNIEAVEKALDVAAKAGVKLLFTCPELKTDPEKTVKRVMKHPALSGYHLTDEPNAGDFAALGAWAKRIQAVDPVHYCYINLLPNYASPEQLFPKDYKVTPGEDIYAAHIEAFVREVPATFISLDHYPVVMKNAVTSLRPEWYKNLEIVAAASQKHRLPVWAFALAVAHEPYPVPTLAELRLQLYSNLAYGAQVLQYFTYWTPGINPNWDFHHAPIGLDGKRTEVYDYIRLVNQEIQALSGVFLDAQLIAVNHTGKYIPAGTRRIDKLPEPVKVLETSEGGAVVSVLEKDKQQFLVIVNRDFKNPMKLTIVVDDRVKRILKDGTIVNANAYAHTLMVEPGDVIIYSWQKNQN